MSTDHSAAQGARIVFEAIVEKVPVKVDVLKKLREICDPDAFFFTNTSSVPIGLLDKEVGLGGRIMGVHFYNPPPVQKLVETIRSEATRDEVVQAVTEIGKRLRKKLIPSADVAGFIGNGHLIRGGMHGLAEVARLAKTHGWVKAAYMVNRVSQEWLVRPMGILQLIDYDEVAIRLLHELGVSHVVVHLDRYRSPRRERIADLLASRTDFQWLETGSEGARFYRLREPR